jgi:hypothetical protein
MAGGQSKMYGLIGKMRTQPGQRDALIAILIAGTGSMPGCLSYVVAKDPADADSIWITDVGQPGESQGIAGAAIGQAMGRRRPLIAGFDQQIPTEPVGGLGLRNP